MHDKMFYIACQASVKITDMKWYKTRVVQYVIFGLIYYAFWKISGNFELTVIIALGQIVGEMHYKE